MVNGDPATTSDEDRLFSLPRGAACGGCEIVRPLGAGAYAEVYLAVDGDGVEWALKRMQLRDKDDRKTRQRFLQEARILERIRHPNVVACEAHGADPDGSLWMKLEYLRGATLRDIAHGRGKLPLEMTLRLGRQVCAGLSELHRARVVHRDIKPENLFLGEAELLKVLDFGIAKLGESSLKTTGRYVLGTALYFAPDYLENDSAATGGQVDPRWDVYSTCITLYELCAGHPFVLRLGKMPAPMVAAKMHLNGEIPELAEQGVPAWAARVIMRGLSRRPEDRQADAMELGRELAEAHQRALHERMAQASAPGTASGRMRLGSATTEPDVVQHFSQVLCVSEPAREALMHGPALARPALGPQGTTRMLPSEVLAPRPVSEAATVAEPAPLSSPPSPEAPALVPARVEARTEPLDRSEGFDTRVPFRDVPAAPAEAAAPPARWPEHNVPETGDPAARDEAEAELWRRLGYLPAEVASRLQAKGVVIAQATSDRGLVAEARARRAPARLSGDAPRPSAWSTRARALAGGLEIRRGWEAIAKPLAVVVGIVCAALVTVWVLRHRATAPTRAEVADGPLVVPIATATATATVSVTAAATATATASARAPSNPHGPAPKPKSTRADELYPTMGDDPPVRPKTKPSIGGGPSAASAAPPARPTAPSGVTKDSPSVLPFGKDEP